MKRRTIRRSVLAVALAMALVSTNASAQSADGAVARIAEWTGLPFRRAANPFEAMASRDALVAYGASLRGVAIALTKIANDLRWMASGPASGLAEIKIPDLQPGSSIMPGKVNPVVLEMALMVSAQVVGADATIAWAGARGDFELNVMMPVIAHNALHATALLSSALGLLSRVREILGRVGDHERARLLVRESSPALAEIDRTLPSGDKVLFVSTKNRSVPAHEYHGEARRLRRKGVLRMIQTYGRRIGLPPEIAHPHALRHMFGTELAEEDVPTITAANLMGHTDPKNTAIYQHLAMRKLTRTLDKANPLAKMKTPVSDLLSSIKKG